MNRLSNDILDIIYRYKHQLEYNSTMNELTQIRINCRYLFSLKCVTKAKYRSHDNILKPCIDLNDLNVESYEILYVIRKNHI
jgi:hypothetical protein